MVWCDPPIWVGSWVLWWLYAPRRVTASPRNWGSSLAEVKTFLPPDFFSRPPSPSTRPSAGPTPIFAHLAWVKTSIFWDPNSLRTPLFIYDYRSHTCSLLCPRTERPPCLWTRGRLRRRRTQMTWQQGSQRPAFPRNAKKTTKPKVREGIKIHGRSWRFKKRILSHLIQRKIPRGTGFSPLFSVKTALWGSQTEGLAKGRSGVEQGQILIFIYN